MELVFFADGKVYDGRFSNNAWLQELPDPITKLCWDNALLMGTETAKELVLARRGSSEPAGPSVAV